MTAGAVERLRTVHAHWSRGDFKSGAWRGGRGVGDVVHGFGTFEGLGAIVGFCADWRTTHEDWAVEKRDVR